MLVCRPRPATNAYYCLQGERASGHECVYEHFPIKKQKELRFKSFFINKRRYVHMHDWNSVEEAKPKCLSTFWIFSGMQFQKHGLLNRYTGLSYQKWARNIQIQNSTPSPVSKLNLLRGDLSLSHMSNKMCTYDVNFSNRIRLFDSICANVTV